MTFQTTNKKNNSIALCMDVKMPIMGWNEKKLSNHHCLLTIPMTTKNKHTRTKVVFVSGHDVEDIQENTGDSVGWRVRFRFEKRSNRNKIHEFVKPKSNNNRNNNNHKTYPTTILLLLIPTMIQNDTNNERKYCYQQQNGDDDKTTTIATNDNQP